MSRRKRAIKSPTERPVPPFLVGKLVPPVVVVMGSPVEVAHLLSAAPDLEATCYQLDLHQAERVREAVAGRVAATQVVTLPDLWDLPAEFRTAVYMPARGGERELK